MEKEEEGFRAPPPPSVATLRAPVRTVAEIHAEMTAQLSLSQAALSRMPLLWRGNLVAFQQRAHVKLHYLQGSEDMAMAFDVSLTQIEMNSLMSIEPSMLETIEGMMVSEQSYCAMILLPDVSEEDTVSAAIFKNQILDRLDRDSQAGVILRFQDLPLYFCPPNKLSRRLKNKIFQNAPQTLSGSFLAAFMLQMHMPR